MDYPPVQSLRELPGPLLITGHTGFKGTWMTLLLEHLRIPVIGFSLPAEQNSLYELAERQGAIPEAFGDIREYETLNSFIEQHRPSSVIHMAAQPLVLKSYKSPRETFDVNVMGTVNVLDIAFKKEYIKAVAVVTTDKVYRNINLGNAFVESDPLEGKDPYSASKVGTESVVTAWQQLSKVAGGPKVISVRAGNVIGGGDFAENRLLPDIVRHIFFGEKLIVRDLNATRPWQHVLDPLFGYLKCLEFVIQGNDVKAINLSGLSQKPLTVSEILCLSSEIVNNYNLPKLDPVIEKNFLGKEAANLNLDSSLANKLISYRNAWNQEEAIVSTLDWWYKVQSQGLSVKDACAYDIFSWESKNL